MPSGENSRKFQIEIIPESCTGCLRCQLACSDLYNKAFNPARARIRVEVSEEGCSIAFTDACNTCGVCVDHCFYEALRKVPEEVAR